MTLGLIINSNGQISDVEISQNFGEFSIAKSELEKFTGWQLKPQGLCIDEICVPVRDSSALTDGKNIDLVEFARLTNQNIVIDQQRRIAALGEHADSRSQSMATLDAPDFTLPDVHGRQVSFSDFNRRKRLLLAWSSW
ncbi:MAG: hypothetical protein EBU68_04105 [Actinobacteria bacterium]|nr:hypothetical protein [Actinomycetota bacterium]